MALSRRSVQRMSGNVWPGFVDAMTGLLLVLMFVLTIFMVLQYVLRETITGQESELDALNLELNELSRALGVATQRNSDLEDDLGGLNAQLDAARNNALAQAALVQSLQGTIAEQNAELESRGVQIASFEEQVASLLAQRDAARAEGVALSADLEALRGENAELITRQEAMQIALAQARDEIDAQEAAASLAAARREALNALIADLRSRVADRDSSLADPSRRAKSSCYMARQRLCLGRHANANA